MKYLRFFILLLAVQTTFTLAFASCDSPLDPFAHLNPAQKKMAEEINSAWTAHVWNPKIPTTSFFHFSEQDAAVMSILKDLGFDISLTERTLRPPENPWTFLEMVRKFIKRQEETFPLLKNNSIFPGIIIRHKTDIKKVLFLTKIMDIPKDAEMWSAVYETTLLENKEYYKAIASGILPITVAKKFSNHEFEHLLSVYHPDSFPSFMIEMRHLANLFSQNKITEQLAFLFSEAFTFVRTENPAVKESFYEFIRLWFMDSSSYQIMQSQIHQLSDDQLYDLTAQFLQLVPSFVLHRGGFIRDAVNVPNQPDALEFLENWKNKRAKENHYIQHFSNQNWRTLIINLTLIYCLAKPELTSDDFRIFFPHAGLTYKHLLEYRKVFPTYKDKHLDYLKIGLAELIWALKESFELNLNSGEVLKATLLPDHPQHQKVKEYFKSAYTSALLPEEHNLSIYYKTIVAKPELPNRFGSRLWRFFTGHW